MRELKLPRHITLTRPHVRGDLRDQIKGLKNDFRKMRASTRWKNIVQGGFYVVEVKRSKADGLWHPHLHIIYDGLFFRQRELAELWSDMVGRRAIAWINAAGVQHARYLAKYVGKPEDISGLAEGHLTEYIQAVDGMRMVQPFGSAMKTKLSDRDVIEPAPPVRASIELNRIAREARRGHFGARCLVTSLATRWPMLSGLLPRGGYAACPRPPSNPPGGEEDWDALIGHQLSLCCEVFQVHPEMLPEQLRGREYWLNHYA